MVSDTQWFLQQLFGTKRDDLYVLIWSLGERKSSFWFTDLDLAAEAARYESARQQEVYLGVGLSERDLGPYKRATATSVAGIPGLWADIDLDWEGAKPGKRRPTTVADARALLSELPDPSILLHSGHGLQAWWLFPEVWEFSDTLERSSAASLAESWTRVIQSAASSQDYSVDSTFDLARVMRVAGTRNYKADPVDVALLSFPSDDLPRYTVGELSRVAAELIVNGHPMPLTNGVSFEDMMEKGPPTPVDATFVMNPDAVPPFDKFEAMTVNQPNFMRSWNRQRKDLSDQSASGYDLSLAVQAVRAGWNDQEVVDLLVSSRRKHGDSLKLRADYFMRTLGKARASAKLDEPSNETIEASRPPDHDEMLQRISHLLGIRVEAIIKYTSSPPRYRMEANGAAFMLGEVNDLIMQNRLRTVIAAELGVYIQKYSPLQWSNLAQTMLNACEERAVAEDETEMGAVDAWVTTYLSEKTILENRDEAAANQTPFIEEGCIHFFGNDLRKWLQLNRFEMISTRDLAARLRAYGCEPVIINTYVRNRRTTRAVWRLSPEWNGRHDHDESLWTDGHGLPVSSADGRRSG